jgi:glycerol-3-phosphate dehydrogenase
VVEWQKIKAEYISGNTSYRKLAEKYGISFNTLKDRAVAEQWYKLRQQNHNKTTTEIIDAVNDKTVQQAVDIVGVADKILKKISDFVEAVPLDLMASSQVMKHLTSALKDIKEIKGIKSDADAREQEARIKKLQMEAAFREEDDDKPCGVVLIPSIAEEIKPPIEEESDG